MKRAISILLAIAICCTMLPKMTAEVSAATIRNPADVSGANYSVEYASKLDDIFNGRVSLFSNTSEKFPLGSSLNNSTEYRVANDTIGGKQCYIYAQAVYYYLFGDIPYHGTGYKYWSDSTPVIENEEFASCDLFQESGVGFGAYLRTTANSDGSYNTNLGHSIIILSYDSTGITYLEGNADGKGLICITTRTWDDFNYELLSKKGRRISHVCQCNSAVNPLIEERYPAHCTIKVSSSKTYVKSLPCSQETDPNSATVEEALKGTQYEAIGLVRNKPGNLWYKVRAKSGAIGYIYAGDTTFVEQLTDDLTASGVVAPTALVQTSKFSIKGTITTKYQTIIKIGAWVDDSNGDYVTGDTEDVNTQAYSLASSKVDKGNKFGELAPGEYTYYIGATIQTYYAKDAKTVSYRSTTITDLHESKFSVTEKPAEHTCDKGSFEYYWKAHPHYNCYKCSICGEIWADKSFSNIIVSCEECRPGKATLDIQTISFDETGETLTFAWEETANTTHYNIWLDRKNSEGNWESVEQVFYAESGLTRSLAPGDYRAQLLSYNSNHWEEDGSDWIHTWADDVFFTVEEAKCSHNYVSTASQAPTCTTNGSITYVCTLCSDTYTETVSAVGHNYISKTIDATCVDYKKVRYTCSNCSDTYEKYADDQHSEWSETKPEGVDEALIETKTQYRYSDGETIESFTPAMEGYTQVGFVWKENGSGTGENVKSWPSGFNTDHSLFSTYNNDPENLIDAIEKDLTKVEIDSESISGYIYYHWCRGTYADGPTNRKTSREYTSECSAFHAFYSTTGPSGMATSADGSVNYANKSCCRDSYWYYDIPVYTQNYTFYCKLFTYARWSDWSQWSDVVYTADDTRKVETRTVYRYVNSGLGEHKYIKDSVTAPTCTERGYTTYTCTVCGDSYDGDHTAALGHSYTAKVTAATCTTQGYTTHTCSRCSDSYKDTYTGATGHSYKNGICSGCGAKDPNTLAITGNYKTFGDASHAITIQLVPAGKTEPAYTFSNADALANTGAWHIDAVAKGTYTVKVTKQNHVTREYSITVGNDALKLDVEIWLLGDVTGDGRIRSNDLSVAYNHINGVAFITDQYILACADVTRDGRIRSNDVSAMAMHISGLAPLW